MTYFILSGEKKTLLRIPMPVSYHYTAIHPHLYYLSIGRPGLPGYPGRVGRDGVRGLPGPPGLAGATGIQLIDLFLVMY